MALATIDDIKLKLWKETLTPFEEQQVQFYLDSTEALIKTIVWGWELWTYNELIEYCELVTRNFYVSNNNPTSINKINTVAYTWVLNTDYLIDGKKIVINDYKNTLDNREFNLIDVEYTAGWDTPDIPKDLIYLHCCIVEWELAKQAGKEVASEKLGPRTVTFVDTPQNRSLLEMIKWKYIIITI